MYSRRFLYYWYINIDTSNNIGTLGWFQGVSIAVVTDNKDRGFAILGFFVAIKKEVSTSQAFKNMSLKKCIVCIVNCDLYIAYVIIPWWKKQQLSNRVVCCHGDGYWILEKLKRGFGFWGQNSCKFNRFRSLAWNFYNLNLSRTFV